MMNKITSSHKRLLFLVSFIMISVFCFGQNYQVKGVVYTKEKLPVKNATVKLEGADEIAITDSTGNFYFSHVSGTNPILEISCVGYKSITYKAKTNAENSIYLKGDEKTLNEVEVLSDYKKRALKNPAMEPAALQLDMQKISTSQIQQTGATNVIEAMKYSISGNLTQQGRKRKNFITLRGQSSVDYAIDGISMYNFMDVTNALSSNLVEDVEITRSSNTLMMGYSGLNGVVNFKTKLFDRNTTLGEFEYGTFNKFHFNLTQGGKITTGLKYVLSVSKDKTDGPSGKNAAEDMWNLYGKINYTYKDKFEATIQHFYMHGMREFAQMQNDKVNVAANNLAMIWKYDPLKFNVTTGIFKYYEGKNATTELQLYYVDSHRKWNKRAYYVSKGTVQRDSIPPYSKINEPYYVFGGGLFQSFSFIKNNVLRLGLMGSRTSTPYAITLEGSKTTTNSDIRSFSGTLIDEHQFKTVTLNGGIKIMRDYYKRYAPGSSALYVEDQWQPATVDVNVGATWKPSPTLLVTLITSGGIINAPHPGLTQIISGNDTTVSVIKNEKRLNIDLGFRKTIPYVGDIAVTGFYINRKNAYEYTGVLYEDENGTENEYLNNVNLKSYGFDLVWNSPEYFGLLHSSMSATLMRTDQTEDGVTSRYNQIPQTMINGSVGIDKYGFSLNMFCKYISRYVGERFVVKNSSDETYYVGDFFNVDASLSYAIPKTPLSVYGRVINIGDVRYCTISPVYPDFGRQFSIGIRASFK